MFTTPILFIVFNRPQETQIVFDEIKKIKPKYLYLAADGPRANKEGEKALCLEVKEIINLIDWDCELKTLFREYNLGCKYAVSQAIQWFFDDVESGIVLEDDCVPAPSFFTYCEELLKKFKEDERIGIITGRNENYKFNNSQTYDFSTSGSIWGWASWKRVIKNYNVDDKNLIKNFKENIYQATLDNFEKNRLYHQLKWTFDGHLNTWDYQFHTMLKLNSYLYVVPKQNLIKNIGFSNNATHTTSIQDKRAHAKLGNVNFPMSHPNYIFPNRVLSKAMVKADSNNYFLFQFLIFNFWLKDKKNRSNESK